MNLLREKKWKTKPTEKEKADARKEKEKDGERIAWIFIYLCLLLFLVQSVAARNVDPSYHIFTNNITFMLKWQPDKTCILRFFFSFFLFFYGPLCNKIASLLFFLCWKNKFVFIVLLVLQWSPLFSAYLELHQRIFFISCMFWLYRKLKSSALLFWLGNAYASQTNEWYCLEKEVSKNASITWTLAIRSCSFLVMIASTNYYGFFFLFLQSEQLV